MKRRPPPSPASSVSSDDRRREALCRSLLTETHPPPLKRERTRGTKPPRAPSPLPRIITPEREKGGEEVKHKVARLLDSYLDRTIGPAADDDDDHHHHHHQHDVAVEEDKKGGSVVSVETEEDDAGFRLFADSKPGTLLMHPKTPNKEKEQESSDEDEEERQRLQSVVVDVKPIN